MLVRQRLVPEQYKNLKGVGLMSATPPSTFYILSRSSNLLTHPPFSPFNMMFKLNLTAALLTVATLFATANALASNPGTHPATCRCGAIKFG